MTDPVLPYSPDEMPEGDRGSERAPAAVHLVDESEL